MKFLEKMGEFIACKGGKDTALRILQRRSRVPSTTLRRVIFDEQKPSFSNGLRIVTSLTNCKKERQALLEELFPVEMKSIRDTFSENSTENDFSGDDLDRLEEHLLTANGCIVVHLCATSIGTSQSEIAAMLGAEGLRALAELEVDGLTVERSGRSFLKNQNFSIRSPEVAKTAAIHLANTFDIENLGSDKAILSIFSESLSAKAVAEIKDAQLEFLKKLGQIRDNPKNIGPLVVCNILMGNVLFENKG